MTESKAELLLDELVHSGKSYMFGGSIITVVSYKIDEFEQVFILIRYITGNERTKQFSLKKLYKSFLEQLLPCGEEAAIEFNYEPTASDNEEQIEKIPKEKIPYMAHNPIITKSGTEVNVKDVPKTFTDLKEILMDNIILLQQGKIPAETAKQIANHVQGIVNITKIEFQYYKEVKGK